ncbi:hypothetical protein BLNAU_22341 [Blattamonas nauphoetae]|uniref:Uncharacterized protein n=1 Tax=Blattamonas nauphoetae TaxID=2049346 RepID=A0ABQ9WTD2_9EUKA|nr:hypothetical protein BLNAU_22341 [Blattamonas nauphoetae]
MSPVCCKRDWDHCDNEIPHRLLRLELQLSNSILCKVWDSGCGRNALVLTSSVTSLISVGQAGVVDLGSSKIENVVFAHSSEGSAVVVEKGGSFVVDSSESMSSIRSNGTGSHLLVFGDTFASIAASVEMQNFKPVIPEIGYFSLEERKMLAGSVNGVAESILYEWHERESGVVHVRREGVNAVKGGHTCLPQQTLSFCLTELVSGGKIVIDSTFSLAEALVQPNSEITISANTHKNEEIGVEVAGPFMTVSSAGSLTITLCSFSGFSSGSSGSVVSASLGETNTLSITSSKFSNCKSDFSGGVIHLTLSSATQSSQIVMKGTFSDCSCGIGKKGDWVFVEGTNLENQIDDLNWSGHPTLFGEVNENLMWGTDSSESSSIYSSSTLLVYLVETTLDEVFLSSLGRDVKGCGLARLPCKTITSSTSHLLNSTTSQVTLHDASTLTGEVVNSWNHLIVCGDEQSSKDVLVSLSGHFSVPIHELSLSFIAFDTNEGYFATSLISLSGTGSLSVDSCSFRSFHSSSNGSIICGAVSSSSFLSLTESSFSSCRSGGDGGVIWVRCEKSVGSSSLVVNCSFDSSCGCGIGCKGEWVFVEGYGFEDLISAPNWERTSSSLSSPTNDSLLFGVDRNETEHSSFHSLSLLYYLTEFRGSTIFVGSDGRDSNGCGHSERICKRLEKGHAHLKGTTSLELFVVETVSLTAVLTFAPNNLVITSQIGRGTVNVERDGSFRDGDLTGTHILTVSQLCFNLDAATCSTLFTTGVGQLILTSCSFAKSDVFDVELVHLVGGEVSIDNTTFSSVSFSVVPFVFSSFSNVQLEKVTFKNCSGLCFVTASGSGESSKLSFDSCYLSGNPHSPPNNTNTEELCSWSTGMMELDSTWATLRSVDISNGRQGGIRQVGGWLSLSNVSFSDNTPSEPGFGSVRHNIDCSGNGTVSLHLEELEAKNLWIGGSECSVENGTELLLSPFFVPTLSSKSSSVQVKKKKTFLVTIVGSTLIPCRLGLEVFEERTDSENSSVSSFLLTPSTTISFNETTITLELNQTELEKQLNKTFAWSGRLVFGKGAKSEESFKVKMSGAEEKKSQAKQAVSIIIPIAASLIALFLLLLVIILVVRRRRRQTKESLASQEELDQVQLDGDGIKFDTLDGTDPSLSTDLVQADKVKTFSGLESASEDTQLKENMIDESDRKEESVRDQPLEVAVMKCEGDFAAQTMNRKDTLYERLHGGQKKEINRKEIILKVIQALQTVVKHHPNAEALTHLSSHWVLFGKDDVMFIQLKEKKGEEHEPQTVQVKQTTSTDPSPTPIHQTHPG